MLHLALFSLLTVLSSNAPDGTTTSPDPTPSRVGWYGTWESGLAEAKRSGRPILLMSAAPQCHGVPGVW